MFKQLIRGLFRQFGCHLQSSRTLAAAQEHLTSLQGLLEQSHKANANFGEQHNELRRKLEHEHESYLAVVEQLQQVQVSGRAHPAPPQNREPETISSDERTQYDAATWVKLGDEEQTKGNEESAIAHYGRALQLIHGYGPARERFLKLSKLYALRANALFNEGKPVEAKRALVRAVELNPNDLDARRRLDEIITADQTYDLTKQCFVHLEPERGKAVYREAFLRAYEYLAAAGLVGEVLEFGVLGGFTARLQCEIMRDLMLFKQIHLFDSFEGLPDYTSAVDRDSYDIGVRNIWADPMRFPDDFVNHHLGGPVDVHIFKRLCELVSPDRVHIYRGFFSETLSSMPAIKASLIHIDCDLYQSTREVFAALYEKDVLQDGCVIMFDDFNCFRANPNFGERRAFREFLEGQERFGATPFFTYGFNGAAFFLYDLTLGLDKS
jgi:tetratricopeptide (TPR) repeat protein